MKRFLVATTLGVSIALSLTACDPPLPPEVRVAILEQNVTCSDGELSMATPYLLSGLADYLSATLSTDCPNMMVTPSEDPSIGDIVITTQPDLTDGKTYIPFALDAAVLGVTMMDATAVQLSPETIAAILSGEITDWGDSRITADNPNSELPSEPILVVPQGRPEVISAFESELSYLLGRTYSTGFEAMPEFDYNDIAYGDDGSIGLLSYLDNSDAYILATAINLSSPEDYVSPDDLSISSAGTQLGLTKKENLLEALIDRSKEVQPLSGASEITKPYSALIPIYIGYEAGNLNAQATALYLLRSQTQGDLSQFSIVQLPESVRLESVALVSEGLPQPELTDEQLQQLGQ